MGHKLPNYSWGHRSQGALPHSTANWVSRRRGTELCVSSFSPKFSSQINHSPNPWPPGQASTETPGARGTVHRQRHQMGTPAHAHRSSHGCAVLSVMFRVLWGSPWLLFIGEGAEKSSLLLFAHRMSDLSHSLCLLIPGKKKLTLFSSVPSEVLPCPTPPCR